MDFHVCCIPFHTVLTIQIIPDSFYVRNRHFGNVSNERTNKKT